MDPDEALTAFNKAVREAEEAYEQYDLIGVHLGYERAVDIAQNLFEWLAKGGFPPNWEAYQPPQPPPQPPQPGQ